MYKKSLLTILALFSAPLFSGQVLAAAPVEKFDLEKTKEVLTRLIEKTIDEKQMPSISIALVRDDAIVWTAAFGYANLKTRTPATAATIYSTASTFKAVTAASVMQLQEKGKLTLADPVNLHLGDTGVQDDKLGGKVVTIDSVLSHWSGLTKSFGKEDAEMISVWSRKAPPPLDQIVPKLGSLREVGTNFEYNNYAYGVAGLIVEKVSGVGYEKYVYENILKPLGVKTANPVCPSPEMVESMATPYDFGKDGMLRPAPHVIADVYPAGAAYLKAEDMARFLGAQLNGGVFQGKRILSEASVKDMQTPRYDGNYGLGLRVRKTADGHTLIRHSGRLPGMSALMLADVDARVGIYYMTNASDDRFEIAEVAIALLRGETYPLAERKAIEVGDGVLDRYVGTYVAGKDVFTVTRDGSVLLLQKNKKAKKARLLPETTTTFFLREDPASISFVMNPDGSVGRLVVTPPDWTQLVAKRSNADPAQAPAVK